MAGDTALRLLIDITARDNARAVISGLGLNLVGLGKSFGLIKAGALAAINSMQYFIHGFPATGMLNLKKGLADLAKGFGQLALAALAMGAIVAVAVGIAIGVMAVKAAGAFQQGLNRLVTGAGDVTDNMKLMGQAILATSVDTGVLTDQLLPAMYQIISANQRGAQAEDTLAVAARGSVVEQAKIVDVAKALTTAMTDYGTKVFNATQYMNGYTRATQLGKITLEELSTSMGPILPYAKNLGIAFSDVAAAMATMTNAGIPAARAATSLRFLFQSLENPTKKALTAMQSFGLSSIALGNELKVSLPGALQMVYNAAKKAGPEGSVPFNRAVSDMIGGMRSMQAFLSLTGSHFKTFTDDAAAIAKAMGISKTAVLGWDVAQQNERVQSARLHAVLQGLLITIGLQLLPYVTRLEAAIVPLVSQFAAWFAKSNALSGVIKTVSEVVSFMAPAVMRVVGAIAAFVGWIARVVTSLHLGSEAMIALKGVAILLGVALLLILAPFIILAVAVVAVIVGILLAIRGLVIAFNWLKQAAIDAWNWIVQAGINAWNWIKGAWETIKGFFKAGVEAIVGSFQWLYNHNYYFKNLVDFIRNVTQSVISWLTTAWHNVSTTLAGVWNTIKTKATELWQNISRIFSSAWSTYIAGPLSALWTSFSTWAGNLAKAAWQWGVNLVQGLINGLLSMLGALLSAAGSLAKQVAKALGFHSPPEWGPASDSDQWAPNFVKMFASGLLANFPQLQAMLARMAALLASVMGGNYSGSYSPPGASFAGGRYPTGGATIVIMAPGPVRSAVYLDKKEVGYHIMDWAGTDVRRHGGPFRNG